MHIKVIWMPYKFTFFGHNKNQRSQRFSFEGKPNENIRIQRIQSSQKSEDEKRRNKFKLTTTAITIYTTYKHLECINGSRFASERAEKNGLQAGGKKFIKNMNRLRQHVTKCGRNVFVCFPFIYILKSFFSLSSPRQYIFFSWIFFNLELIFLFQMWNQENSRRIEYIKLLWHGFQAEQTEGRRSIVRQSTSSYH